MYATRRRIDFLSIRELMDKPLVGWFFRSLNAMPLDRGRIDAVTIRQVVKRLKRGRVVGIFPEGGFRKARASVLKGGSFRSGIGRIAQLADVPIVPVAILDTSNFRPWTSWLPLRRTRFAVAFGEPIHLRLDLEKKEARLQAEEEWRQAVVNLGQQLEEKIDWR